MGTARERAIAEIERELAAFPGTGGGAAKHLGTGEEIRLNDQRPTPNSRPSRPSGATTRGGRSRPARKRGRGA